MTFVQPVTLTGERWVVLEPLGPQHAEGLRAAAAGLEPLWYTSNPTPETADAYLADALATRTGEEALAFAVRRKDTGEVVGSTSYCHGDAVHRRLEIGYTWYARAVHRTGLNTEAKRLLLGHAFDTLRCIAVEFRTHHLNTASRRAIERLGARQDGILRSHQVLADGSIRDTVVYSVTAQEWPAVRNHLDFQLARPR